MFNRTSLLIPAICLSLASLFSANLLAADPLHRRIDSIVEEKASPGAVSPPSDDAEFLRRVSLDLAGTIPRPSEVRRFLDDASEGKRTKVIDTLLSAPEYADRMADAVNVMFMERLGDSEVWSNYLKAAFRQNRPWDQMTRDMLRGSAEGEAAAEGAAFFLSKRLENYGQNPVDYSGLARDIGRLFLGKDLRCAECHDHLFIDDYKQRDFQGLFAFIQNAYLVDAKSARIAEKPATGKVSFMSVFKKEPKETGPALPGGKETVPAVFKKGDEYQQKPDPKTKTPGKPKFSALEILARDLPTPETPDFARNFVNRIWFVLLGRGIVHPLDLHHKDNPPSYPKLLDVLAEEFVRSKYDVKHLVREIVLSRAYQRSSRLPESGSLSAPGLFHTAIEKRLSSEQWMQSISRALGVTLNAAATAKIRKAFDNAPREPEDEIAPSLKAALFVLNDPVVLKWTVPDSGNTVERAMKQGDAECVDELYLTILNRRPSETEKSRMTSYLKAGSADRAKAVGRLAWALAASTEFNVNH